MLLLTCDAQGVLPPIARLTPEQALYHFVSGYTSKVAGTEAGVGVDPEITFSTCFGAPFMVHHPGVYADLLQPEDRAARRVTCWLVNTGWVGGPFGIGERISIAHTRALLDAALSGALDDVELRGRPGLRLRGAHELPRRSTRELLRPGWSWPSEEEYHERRRELAARYIGNFRKFEDECPPELVAAGPHLEPVSAV